MRSSLASSLRITAANDRRVEPDRSFVLYWMIAARRPHWNHALDRAIAYARDLKKPVVVLEALRVGYPWASDRLHRFVLDGMADNAASFARSAVTYFPYVEPTADHGKDLLRTLAGSACVVVTDEFPCFFLPRMVRAAASQVDVLLETVDSNGLLPLAAADRAYTAAPHFRRFVQRQLVDHPPVAPAANPLRNLELPRLPRVPTTVSRRWEPVDERLLSGASSLTALPIDHDVPVSSMHGGHRAATAALSSFVRERLATYGEAKKHPDANGTSRLSPYLHFGHLSAHQVFAAVLQQEQVAVRRWSPPPATGARDGWWGLSASAEAFLDEFVVWRELSYNFSAKRPTDYHRYESLPPWALQTLEDHRADPRPHVYTPTQFERAATHDVLWNAAQTQLVREGWFHGYLRILWAKKILEYSKTPQQALGIMTQLMNRWSLDGRNPNAYAGYLWTLGRYDHPWPTRPIFGAVRSMSSERTRKKVHVERYLEEYGAQ